MTPDENRLLATFLDQLAQVRGIAKDPAAAAMIGEAAARQPDALYLLVQRSLLQDQALATANARIASLETQLRSAPGATSDSAFLDPRNAWGRAASAVPPAGAGSNPAFGYPAAPVYAQAPPRTGLFGGGQGGSFLTSMAATAAGVAGGAFLFQGIESLMGHHGDAGHLMGQSNPFGSMADSVDQSGGDFPAPRQEFLDNAPAVDSDRSSDQGIVSDDTGSGSDDSVA